MRKKLYAILLVVALAALGLASAASAAQPPGFSDSLAIMSSTGVVSADALKSSMPTILADAKGAIYNEPKAATDSNTKKIGLVANSDGKRLKTEVIAYSEPPGQIIAEVSSKKLFITPLARLAHPDIVGASDTSMKCSVTLTSIGASSRDAPQTLTGIDTRAAPSSNNALG